jgi:hypothetical protein
MKTKVLFFLLAACLLALAAWLVRVPNPVQADDIPEKYRDTVSKGPRSARITGQARGLAPWSGAPYLSVESDR